MRDADFNNSSIATACSTQAHGSGHIDYCCRMCRSLLGGAFSEVSPVLFFFFFCGTACMAAFCLFVAPALVFAFLTL
jgi:hypothetical protein